MCKHFLSFIFFTTIFLLGNNLKAQRTKVGCLDKDIRLQTEQIKHDFKAQSMTVYKDAMLSMKSGEPSAIGVQLDKGQLYQFIYVCGKSSTKAQFELFDGGHKKLVSEVIKSPSQKNFIIYSFIPTTTDVYLVVLNQSVKSKSLFKKSNANTNMCGSFAIMQKGK